MVKKAGMFPEKNALNYARFVKRKIVHVIVRNVERVNKNAHVRKPVPSVTKYNHSVNVIRANLR